MRQPPKTCSKTKRRACRLAQPVQLRETTGYLEIVVRKIDPSRPDTIFEILLLTIKPPSEVIILRKNFPRISFTPKSLVSRSLETKEYTIYIDQPYSQLTL